MNFIVIFVALLLDQLLRPFEHLREHHRYEGVCAGWANVAAGWGRIPQVLAGIIPGFLLGFAAGAIGWGLALISPFFAFAYGILVLLLCLGPRDLITQVSTYLKARAAGDEALAAQAVRSLLGGSSQEDPAKLGRQVAEAALEHAADRLFAVIFWFALLGPLGAVLFRVADIMATRARVDCPGGAYARAVQALKSVLAWVPVHLLALTYALAGNFDETLQAIRNSYHDVKVHFLDPDFGVLAHAGRATLSAIKEDGNEEVAILHAAVDIIWRSVVIWLAVIGVVTLLGWLF